MSWPTLDTIVSLAQANLGMTSDEYRIVMRKHGKIAMSHLGLFFISTKTACLEIGSDGLAKKPCDFLAPLKIRVSVGGANNAVPNYQPWVSDGVGCESNTGCHIIVGENEHFFFVNPAEVGTMNIVYYALLSNSKGEILVPEYAEEAVSAYIEMRAMVIRQRREGYRMIPNSMIQDSRMVWAEASRVARSRKNTPKPGEEAGIAGTWLTMQPDIWPLVANRVNNL